MSAYSSSPQHSVETLERLAAMLKDPSSRAEALAELETLVVLVDGRAGNAPLRLCELELAAGTTPLALRLLLLPSMQPPQPDSLPLLSGLLRLPVEELEGKRLLHRSAGAGWLCIALARLTGLAQIEGADATPHAAALATCNLWLNCEEGIASRVNFSHGDPLRERPPDDRWDLLVASLADEGELDALLDEAPERILPGGWVLVEIPSWPGRSTLERAFARRGFAAKPVAVGRRQPTPPVRLAALAAREEDGEGPFELFLREESRDPVGARTALRWEAAGNDVWHETSVWEARLARPRPWLALRRALREAGRDRLLSSLDPSGAGNERVGLAATLASRLARQPALPCPEPGGDGSLRESLRHHLARSFDLWLAETEVFCAPDLRQALYSLLFAVCDPGDEVLVARSVADSLASVFEKARVRRIEAPDSPEDLRSLLRVVAPLAVVLGASEDKAQIPALLALADDAAERGVWTVLIARHAPQHPEQSTLLARLGREPHRHNLVILMELSAGDAYPDHELALLLPVPERLFSDLEIAAETTGARLSAPVQWFFESMIADLLAFQVAPAAAQGPARRQLLRAPLPRSQRIQEFAAAPPFAPRFFRADDPRLLRLDRGDNRERIPLVLLESLLFGALRPASNDAALREAIAAFVAETRGVETDAAEVVVGRGVRGLLHDAAIALGRVLGRPPEVFAVAPCHGLLPHALRAAGCAVRAGPLASLLEGRASPPDLVLLSQPGDPDGCYLEGSALRALADYALKHGCWIFSNEVAGLLTLHRPKASQVPSPLGVEPRLLPRILVFGGLAKEFAAGGLRLGWVVVRSSPLRKALASLVLERPPGMVMAAAAHLYGAWLRTPEGRPAQPKRRAALDAYLECLRRELSVRRERLAAIFDREGRAGDAGGLFLTPDVSGLLGRTIDGEELTAENLPRLLYRHTGVVVNGGLWCFDRERIHLAYGIPREGVEEAARRLEAFLGRLGS